MKINGFLRAHGKRIVDGDGNEILLRGMGLGNWLLPEGYMWKFFTSCDRPRRIEALIGDLVGNKRSEEFWKIYRERYITEADIIRIRKEGLNSIRLPINYRVIFDCESGNLISEGIRLVDRVIDWCSMHGIYVILDLHGAPGGQTGTNIDDSINDKPELFIYENNQSLTIELWRKLAERYSDNPTIGGYDLLNEPLPDWFNQYNFMIMPFYRDITNAIREVDSNHMIILEGAHWSTDWSIFQELDHTPFDNNYMLQFHKYWSNPDKESIRSFMEFSDRLNVPIFMGEGGENNKAWYTGVFQMYEDLNISWNFWVWKKLDTDNSPCSIIRPDDWQLILDFIDGGRKPDEETSWRILRQYLNNISFENCQYNQYVINHVLRRVPVQIPAEHYNSCIDKSKNFHIKKPRHGTAKLRTTDGTGINFIHSKGKLNYKHYNGEERDEKERLCLELMAGDWFNYSFNCLNAASCKIIVRCVAVKAVASLDLSINGGEKYTIPVDSTSWCEICAADDLSIDSGSHTLRLECQAESVKVEWIKIEA